MQHTKMWRNTMQRITIRSILYSKQPYGKLRGPSAALS